MLHFRAACLRVANTGVKNVSLWEQAPARSVTMMLGPASRDPREKQGMKRSTERILTTHVGSLIRPESLLALGSQKTGSLNGAYAAALREAVAAVVRQQVAAGVDIVNDGEYGKSSWANYVLERIKGFEVREGRFDSRDWLGRERERFPELIEAEFGVYVKRPVQAC